MAEERPDAKLVGAAALGDADAFGALVRRYMRGALAVAWEYAATRDDAEDLVQDAFIRVLESLDRFDPERRFPPWFYSILRNTGRNHALARGRRAQVPLSAELPAEQVAADVRVERLAFRERLVGAVEALPVMQRSCFRLRDLEGFSGPEVAAMLGIGESTVRVHLHRARKALRPVLAPAVDEVGR